MTFAPLPPPFFPGLCMCVPVGSGHSRQQVRRNGIASKGGGRSLVGRTAERSRRNIAPLDGKEEEEPMKLCGRGRGGRRKSPLLPLPPPPPPPLFCLWWEESYSREGGEREGLASREGPSCMVNRALPSKRPTRGLPPPDHT